MTTPQPLDREQHLSEHFQLFEFVRPQDPDPPVDVLANLKRLCIRLEWVRQKNAAPISINSGWRTNAHQTELYKYLHGKEPVAAPGNSYHEKGEAADIPKDCLKDGLIDHLWHTWQGGMGRYTWGIHLDIGPFRRW